MYNKKHKEETKQKMKENHSDFKGKNNPFYGRHHSDETKEKLRQYWNNKKYSKDILNE